MTDQTAASRWLGNSFLVAVLGFLLLPLLVIIPASFIDARYLEFPPAKLSLRWYDTFFSSDPWLVAVSNSLQIATITTAVSVAIGTMAALGLARGRFVGRQAIVAMFLAPIIIPQILIGIGLYGLYLRLGVVGTLPGVVAAHAVLAMPYTILLVSDSLRQLDPDIERASRIFGATAFQPFFLMTLPQIKPALFASAVFSFFVSFDELVVTLFIKGSMETLPTRIWNDLKFEINPTIAAVASLLVSLTMAGMLLAELARRRSIRCNSDGNPIASSDTH